MPHFRNEDRRASSSLAASLGVALLLAVAATAPAQVVSDPANRGVRPVATSLARRSTAGNRRSCGTSWVSTWSGRRAPFATVDMGKPDPEADGKIRYDFSSGVAAWPLTGRLLRSPRQRRRLGRGGAQRPVEPVRIRHRVVVQHVLERNDAADAGIGRRLRGGRLHRHGLLLDGRLRALVGYAVELQRGRVTGRSPSRSSPTRPRPAARASSRLAGSRWPSASRAWPWPATSWANPCRHRSGHTAQFDATQREGQCPWRVRLQSRELEPCSVPAHTR